MYICASKPEHAELYENSMRKYGNVISTFGRDFENNIKKLILKGRAQKSDDVTTVDQMILLGTVKTMTRSRKYTIRAIPKHVWCEIAIAAIYHNFDKKSTQKSVIAEIYRSYMNRECLVDSDKPRERFTAEHDDFLSKRARSKR